MSNTSSNTQSNNIKTVRYYGKVFEVPSNAKYIHTDSCGQVYTTQDQYEVQPLGTSWIRPIERFPSAYPVYSFNHTQMSTINWMLSQKRIQDLPSVTYTTPEKEPIAHPHADLMLKYAQIAQYSDKPWEEFEFKTIEGVWVECSHLTRFNTSRQYRMKPQQVQIQVGQVWESSKTKVKFSVVGTDVDFYTDNLCVTLNHSLDVGLDIPYTVTEDTLRKHFQLVK